ncbi:hypothetical protein JTE90_005703 [Oedothorax gibbosus]|uniref:Uncharacterized protein n=1 Tax=Oedothorax gibbosus TaxID=931172 RepID=A0AAV6UGY6_9ARAC|nr:hypothetical protein JTE90_005703 [Oedothorax gibbosus]
MNLFAVFHPVSSVGCPRGCFGSLTLDSFHLGGTCQVCALEGEKKGLKTCECVKKTFPLLGPCVEESVCLE